MNHTFVYYNHKSSDGIKGCYFNVHSPKTDAGIRLVPMLSFVKEAFLMERDIHELLDLKYEVTIDGYTDFIFLNRFGETQHQGCINKAIRRIIRDCNDEQFEKSENPEVLLPPFSCHTLRHTFTNRMYEAGVKPKVMMEALGHADISTTMNIYADVLEEFNVEAFKGLDKYYDVEYNKILC